MTRAGIVVTEAVIILCPSCYEAIPCYMGSWLFDEEAFDHMPDQVVCSECGATVKKPKSPFVVPKRLQIKLSPLPQVVGK